MKLRNPLVSLYNNQDYSIGGIYKAIQDAATICYQSTSKKSPKEFVDMLLKKGHTRPLEFGTVYLKCESIYSSKGVVDEINTNPLFKYQANPYSKSIYRDGMCYVTTNFRVIMQGDYATDKEAFEHGYDKNWLNDITMYGCAYPTEYHEKRKTICIVCSRGAVDDFRTHITLSSICESTRYCNYSKKGGLTFIDPVWWKGQGYVYHSIIGSYYKIEKDYQEIAEMGAQAQQMKRIVPLGIKAELRLCGFQDAWDNFLWRRMDSHADPECQMIANKINDLLRW